jgi:hypothetical protein
MLAQNIFEANRTAFVLLIACEISIYISAKPANRFMKPLVQH